jgi:hypothetical protein
METIITEKKKHAGIFYVVHPLDDEPEVKRSADNLGPMVMTGTVKWSLLALRGYLVLMGLLVMIHVLNLAGLFQQSPK